ncbi:CG8661 [Drosophila busckii]|uniref:CG8661 n=1 Tax=Drosophila busckii TaxID=30019 RepID=A0A0M5J5V6_DROBS|nr:uncharacterized protein LOC108606079 [Drosophila busckii]ALC48468.1 CG8661 [Drosophila busckii]
MKFTLFALFAAVCVLSVNAGTFQPLAQAPDVGMEFAPNDLSDDEFINFEPEFGSFFSTTWWVIKACLRTVKGFNCLIKWVIGIKASALQYAADITGCGIAATQDVTNLINANLKIITTCNNIINYQENICSSTQNEEKPSITSNCGGKVLYSVFTLYKQTKTAIALGKKITKTGSNAGTCVVNATNTLTNYYTQFPANIKLCSQLSKN